MHFLFLGVFQKHLEIFHNVTYAPRGRLKAFQSMLEEADKNKTDNQDRIRDILKKESVMLFDVCYKTLRSYDDYMSPIGTGSPPAKHKPDFKLPNEVEDILLLLQRLFNEFPPEKITEVSSDDFYKVVYNVMRPSTADKYKTYGFFLLTSYMNFLRQLSIPINDPIYALFECVFPYHEVPEEGLVMCKKIPALIEQPTSEKWVQSIAKEPSDPKSAGLIKNYFQIIQRFIEADTGTSVFWLELMKKAWLKYLYPKIYAKYLSVPVEPVGVSSAPALDPDTMGFHPFSPPVVHTVVCKLLLRILKSKELEDVRNERYQTKESFCFTLEVLSQTFMLFTRKNPAYAEYYKLYTEIKREFIRYLKDLIAGYYMPKHLERIDWEVYMKSVSCVFSLFNSADCLSTLQEEEFSELMNSIDICLRRFADPTKQPSSHQILTQHVFDSLLFATEKTQAYLEEQKKGKDVYYTNESRLFLTFTDLMIRYMFTLCLSNPQPESPLWDKMRSFCQSLLSTQMLILVWQKALFDCTSGLSDLLSNPPEDDLKTLSNPAVAPFEDLGMKKEYALQVVFNACSAKRDDPKFALVKTARIYKAFEGWIKLLRVVEIPAGYSNKMVLTEYVRCRLFRVKISAY